MPRYFIEVSYKGTVYSGFQVQQNAVTIQSEIEKALQIYFKDTFSLTGSSRTDAGVHALQNFFHFDTSADLFLNTGKDFARNRFVYNLNAILPKDIVIKRVFQVNDNAHSRFDAVAREYKYFIYRHKNPFLEDRAYYFPYSVDIDRLNEAAGILLQQTDFTSFSKRNTQVNNFNCTLYKSEWILEAGQLIYNVKGNRFLRGMVKGLVGTMLRVGMNKITIEEFSQIIMDKNCARADFSVPSHGLFLVAVLY